MAEVNGFSCDSCGTIWSTLNKRTKVTMRFEKTDFCDLGTYTRDLCPNCTVEPFDWTPSRKNRNAPQYRPIAVPESDPISRSEDLI